MPDDPATLRTALDALRADLEKLTLQHQQLRLEHVKLCCTLGCGQLREGEPWPDYPHLATEALSVRDSPTAIPIIIRTTEDGAALTLRDPSHRTRAELSIGANGALLELRNAQGHLIFQLSEAPDGSGQLCVCDAAGHPRAGLRVSENGGVVNVIDPKGRPQAFLTGSSEGGQIFAISAQHVPGVTMKATARGGLVSVHEPGGQLMGFLMGSANTGSCTVHGPHGAPAVAIGGAEGGGGIVFYDTDGHITTSLP